MANNKTYEELVKKYKETMKIVSNMKLKPKQRLETMIETNNLFFNNIENLNSDEFDRMTSYSNLVERNYRNNLELRWAENL